MKATAESLQIKEKNRKARSLKREQDKKEKDDREESLLNQSMAREASFNSSVEHRFPLYNIKE